MKKRIFFRRPFKYQFTRNTLTIIFINIIVFAICYFMPEVGKRILFYGSLNPINFEHNHMYWQIFTYMFIHQNISHIFFNMIGLLVFGLSLERTIGSKEFTLFYLVTGVLSALFSWLVYKFTGQYRVFLLGASGAIYAVLFAYAVFFPRSIIYIWGIIPVPAPIMVLIYTIIELGSEFFGARGNVAHLTHLFGFFAAWLYFVIRMGIHPVKIWKNEYRK